MTHIGIVSDTHGHWDERGNAFFEGCQQIWHAGDIGALAVTEALKRLCPIRAVYGNIDDHATRLEFPKNQLFTLEGLRILITHIGGHPAHWAPGIKDLIQREKPNILVCGHSHLLKVEFVKSLNLLYINPGAYGLTGFHKVRTLISLDLDNGQPKNLQVFEVKRWPTAPCPPKS